MVLKNRLAGAALLLGILIASAPAFAQQPQEGSAADTGGRTERGSHRGGRRGGRGDMHMLRMLRQLELTEAQQQQARNIVENYLAATKPQREELSRLREQKEQGAEGADLHSKAQSLHTQMREATKNMRAEVLAILTPDQRARLDQMETEFKGRREQLRERRRTMPENDEQQQQ